MVLRGLLSTCALRWCMPLLRTGACFHSPCPQPSARPVSTRRRRAGNTYPRIDPSAGDPGFCYDTGLLLPAFNPLAVELPSGQLPAGAVLAASPLSTLLVFGQPIGAPPCRRGQCRNQTCHKCNASIQL